MNPQQLSGRSSSRGGFKSKYHFNNKSERFSSESAPNLETSLANVSISNPAQHEKQYHYQPRQQNNNQLQPRHYYNSNKYYSNNRHMSASNINTSYHANEYQTHQQQHYNNTLPTTTNEDKKNHDVISTVKVGIDAELDQFPTTKQTIQDTTRKTIITYKSKKKGNHGNGNNSSHSNEVNLINNDGDQVKTEYHNKKKNNKTNALVISNNHSEGASENNQRGKPSLAQILL